MAPPAPYGAVEAELGRKRLTGSLHPQPGRLAEAHAKRNAPHRRCPKLPRGHGLARGALVSSPYGQMKHQDALDQLARETSRVRRRLGVERGVRLALPTAALIAAWSALALVGLADRLAPIAQSLAAIGILFMLVWLARTAWRRWRTPTEAEARARLAHDCALDGAAFETLRDRPSRYDPLTLALWRREQDQARAHAEKARAGPTRPHLDQLDPYKVRYLLGALLIATFVIAGDTASDRLARAFLPDPGPLLGDQPLQIEAWATPADYTRSAPISLSDRLGERIETPPSVEVTVRVTGPVGAPRLVFRGQGVRRGARFQQAADGAWEAQLALPGPGRLSIVRFHTRASWRIAPAHDRAPSAAFSAPLARLPDQQVSFSWNASDDFGVTRLALRVRPRHPPAGLLHAGPVDTPVETPAGDPQQAQGDAELDLATHPYAGMEVEARIVAIDALGQEGQSEPLHFTLPEKVFLQPLARAVIEIRGNIMRERRAYRPMPTEPRRTIQAGDLLVGNQRIEIRDYQRRNDIARAPQGIRHAARLVDALTMAPEDGYFSDLAVFLGLRMARSELTTARDIAATDSAADILWRTALRAEYGGAADARRALEAAQQALSQALASGAPQERLRQLLDALRRATDAYLQALVQEAIRNGEPPQNQDDTQDQTEISEQDIQELLERVQQLTEQGRTQEAQALLQMLANIFSNLDAQLSQRQSGENGEQGPSDQQMQQSMDQLSETIGQQRALRDETQQQQQQQSAGGGGGEQRGGQGGEDSAERQAEIRQGLGEAQRDAEGAGAAPSQDLNAAERAMQQSEGALRRGDLAAAQAAQSSALEHLRQGAEQLGAEIRESGNREGEQGEAGNRDPLGRSTGAGDGRQTQVPDAIDPVRARAILDEIRRRAQDANRPESEREYLRRLLDRFSDS